MRPENRNSDKITQELIVDAGSLWEVGNVEKAEIGYNSLEVRS
jgi:hypothetical protein